MVSVDISMCCDTCGKVEIANATSDQGVKLPWGWQHNITATVYRCEKCLVKVGYLDDKR